MFSHRQRRDYRAEVERRLFDGAPIDQHIGLINVVRSPRVGDRIDVDLPQHLIDALPELSEQALADAAQPLEDLEEHRGNVAELGRTLKAARGLLDVYRAYCRSELHQRVADGKNRLADKRDRSQAEARAQQKTASAQAEVARLNDEISTLEDDRRSLASEIAALEESQIYRDGQELDALRQLVATLEQKHARAATRVAESTRRVDLAAREMEQARQQGRDDVRKLNKELADAAELGQRCRIDRRPPGPAALNELDMDGAGPPQPDEGFDPEEIGRPLAAARGSVLSRRDDVEKVNAARAKLESAEQQFSLAQSALQMAAHTSDEASSRLAEQRQRLATARREWDGRARQWAVRISPLLEAGEVDAPTIAVFASSDSADRHASADAGQPGRPGIAGAGPPADSREAERADLKAEAEDLVGYWQGQAAAIEHRLAVERGDLEEAQAQFDELASRSEPEPPRQDWQAAADHCLADLIDFAPHLDDDQQASLEAALHASGLLSARLHGESTVELADGELLALAAGGVSRPLSEHLVVTVPEQLAGAVDEGLVAKLLDSISCDLSSSAPTVVALDGGFHLGSLRGRHTKQRAEFVGATARRAALDRARQEASEHLARAQAAVSASEAERARCRESLTRAQQHLSDLPPTVEIMAASTGVDDAIAASDKAESDRAAAARRSAEAEARSTEASNALLQTATSLALPKDRTGLRRFVTDLGDLKSALERCGALLDAFGRSVESWRRATTRWGAENSDLDAKKAEERADETEYRNERTRLTTIEESIGAEYADILAAREGRRSKQQETESRLSSARDELDLAVERHADARAEARSAAERRVAAERSCEEMARSLAAAAQTVEQQHEQLASLLSQKQDTALRALLQGLVAREVAEKVRGAQHLVELMNKRLATVTTAHQVGVRLRWRRSPELDPATDRMVDLFATLPDLRTDDDEQELRRVLSHRLDEARSLQPDVPYRQVISDTLDYKKWHELSVMVRRPDSNDVKLGRTTPLSEGEKKLVTYLPLFAAVAASYDALAERTGSPGGPTAGIARFILLDDAFAKVSEDNHDPLFGLLVKLDLDLIATSERLWGTHRSVPELAITEVVRDVGLNTILLEHYRWDGDTLELQGAT